MHRIFIGVSLTYYILVVLIAHLIAPDTYQWSKNTISDLGAQHYSHAWLMRVGFIGFSILLNTGIVLKFRHQSDIFYPELFIMIYALSVLMTGIFSVAPFDSTQGYSSSQDNLHSNFALLAGIAFSFTIAGYIFAIDPPSQKRLHTLFLFIVIGTSMLVGFAKNDSLGNIGMGIVQRLLQAVSFLWMFLTYLILDN